jgi:predicted LPLAT superfamily acyltransferase
MPAWNRQRERGSPTALRLILWIALHLGRRPARLVLYPITVYFLARAVAPRRASRRFLTRALGRNVGLVDVGRHIHCFAATILDRVYLLAGRLEKFDVHLHQPELITERVAAGRGFLLLGSHLGSFEVMRAMAIQAAGMPLKILMDPGHNRRLTDLLHALNPAFAASVIPLDGPYPLLAVSETLRNGGVVGLLGDRCLPGEPTVSCDFLGAPARFPTGPFSLAALTGVPVILAFGLYRGGNRYDLHFELLTERLTLQRRDRTTGLKDHAQRYADRLAHYARDAPYNWFNFYDFWEADADAALVEH